LVVDLWAGWRDVGKTQPWQSDTIVRVFSTTKIMAIMSLLMVIDRGLIELDEPVARYWPEFAAGGKDKVTVRDAMTHQSGVPGLDPPVAYEVFRDWLRGTARIAAEPHWFDGRKVFCYHHVTYGHLLGELIRRVDGRRPAQFFREEIAEKIGADFQIGLSSKSDLSRVAELKWAANPAPFPPGSLADRSANSVLPPADPLSWEARSAEGFSGNGYANGRSIAQVCSIMALGGTVGGRRYLSREMIEEASKEQVYAEDAGFGWIRMGLGLGLHSNYFPAPTTTCFHWGGYGGSWACMDPKIGVSLGYACNNLLVGFDSLEPRLKRFSDTVAQLAPRL
jgi:CubicO group peptidase (beta-lactamase class C family)